MGKHLIAHLSNVDMNVTVLGRESTLSALDNLRYSFIYYDLSQPLSNINVEKNKFDTAIFLAQSRDYKHLPDKAPEIFSVNVLGFVKFLEIARICGAKQVIYASSGSVYEPSFHKLKEDASIIPPNLYGLSKKFGEDLADYYRSYFKIASLRFFFIYGPGQKNMMVPGLIEKVRTGGAVILDRAEFEDDTTGGFRTNPIYVRDAVEIISTLIKKETDGILNISGSEILSIRDMADAMGDCLNIEPRFEVSSKIRKGDYIADNSKLISIYKGSFTNFRTGISNMIR